LPDSRIMERGGQFTQAYNGHIAVDDEWHVIVGPCASNQAPDTEYFIPKTTANAGFWSPENARWAEEHAVDAYISTQRQRHGAPATDPAEPPGPTATPPADAPQGQRARGSGRLPTTEVPPGTGVRPDQAGHGVQAAS
jgi:hypothetical protein